jgi:hypothetical protein
MWNMPTWRSPGGQATRDGALAAPFQQRLCLPVLDCDSNCTDAAQWSGTSIGAAYARYDGMG